MTTALLLQTSRWRDAAHDAALTAAARELDPIRVVAATADPDRTRRRTGLTAIAATRTAVLRALRRVDAIVLLGGRPLASAATDNHVFGLADLYAISIATRTAGKRFVLLGVAAGPLTGRRDAYLARRLMISGALAVLDEPTSAERLIQAGVPSPVRVGAHVGWLELQRPPTGPDDRSDQDGFDRRPGEQLWTTTTRSGVDARGGAEVIVEELAAVQAALARRLDPPAPGVVVQAWRGGVASGDDLEAASEVATGLRLRRIPARVVAPALTLAEERDAMASVTLCVTGHPHAMMAAAAAGIGLIGWPNSPGTQALAEWLDVPTLPGAAEQVVDRALAGAGEVLPRVRQQIAAAGEVLDLLRVLLSDGGELPRMPSGSAGQPRLRPTGVMR
jgi:hypothetical protein